MHKEGFLSLGDVGGGWFSQGGQGAILGLAAGAGPFPNCWALLSAVTLVLSTTMSCLACKCFCCLSDFSAVLKRICSCCVEPKQVSSYVGISLPLSLRCLLLQG